jgi:hypothetical protein
MLLVQEGVQQQDVWNHWQRVEQHLSPNFRSDIRDRLPHDLVWSRYEVQSEDIDRLFIISSEDWLDISGGTFKVADVVTRLNLPSSDSNTKRIANNIQDKLRFLSSGGQLDSQLIAITNNPAQSGPFTFIEGNKRAVAFQHLRCLVGVTIFVGCSPSVVHCWWARYSYR